MKENFVSRKQVNLLPERLRKAEETNAAKEFHDYMWDLFGEKDFACLKVMLVGAGGSYPVALFGKHAIHDEMHTPNVEAVLPQTAIKIISQFDHIVTCDYKPQYDLVIGISYSGKSPDIITVSDLCRQKNFPFVLLTGEQKSNLLDFYTENEFCKIVSYFNPEDTTGKEKGMISMFSTLAPAAIFDDFYRKYIEENLSCLLNGNKYVSHLNVTSIARRIKKYPIIHVFYDWTTLPAAIDIKSKFTESGLANVILHEKKNFSHGCYTALYNQKFALVINLVRYHSYLYFSNGSWKSDNLYRNQYDEFLSTFLKKKCKDFSSHYLELGTPKLTATQWNLDVMTIFPYLVTAIGEELDIDISKPLIPFPKEVLDLYSYKGDFYS